MSWRVAKSLEKLDAQINAAFPNRNTRSDGFIGDESHRSRVSDHNPWLVINGIGVVTAGDWTDDDGVGFDTDEFTDQLAASRDRRLKYVIANGWIMDTREPFHPWEWRPHPGAPHHRHVHISVMPGHHLVDDESPWDIPMLRVPDQRPRPPRLPRHRVGSRVLYLRGSERMHGTDVRELQRVLNAWYPRLNLDVDGWYGPQTEQAVRTLQARAGIRMDGEAGPQTFGVLGMA